MKDTIIIKIDTENIDDKLIEKCAGILREGGTVVFPTETVYGLGADALNPEAVKKIFKAKGRPSNNPLIIHISKAENVLPLVEEIPEKAHGLMKEFWPGPLTLIFKKSEIVPRETSGGLSTVAIRIPNNSIAIKLIEEAGVPIAAPSANVSGKLSPTKAEHVMEDLMGKVDAIIVGGDCNIGIESTVLDMTAETPIILRPGTVTREMLERVLGESPINLSMENPNKVRGESDSPGTKHIHYLPDAKITVVQGDLDDIVAKINELRTEYEREDKKIGIICTDETKNRYEKNMNRNGGTLNRHGKNMGSVIIKSLGSRKYPETIAVNLFKVLREFDKTDAEIILCESVSDTGIGQAIMDRLEKVASTIVQQ
ncbi:MAG: L-threonylcarbamoyladenylate synthase [Candidatus Alkaliphilus sp. MAG34]|nr:threonylcarbamoyl-AMP synthase [Clostridiales bacterium]